jgi:HisJ family histidinol phosphate phosphatase
MLFLWFYHACRRNSPRFLMVSDHINYLTFEDPGAVHTVRRALKLAHAGDLYGAAETAGVDVAHAAVVGEGLRRGMRFSIGAEVDNDPRARPDAQNIVDAMRPDGIIRSVHFLTIDHPEKGADFQWPYDNPEFANLYDTVGVDRVWELYTARLFDDIEKLPGNIVGHFYKPAVFGHWPDQGQLEAYEDRLLELASARNMAVEINARPLYRHHSDEQRQKYIEANTRLMRKAKARNVGIAIGSDAHSPKDQGGAFDVVLRMLDDAEINEIVFPVGGRLARVVLRATKELLEAQQRTSEPAQPGSSITGLSRAELGLPEEAETVKAPREAKTAHDVGPKKRASSPDRTTRKPAADETPAKSSSKRSAESAASSAVAKAGKKAATVKAEPAKKAEPVKSTPAKAAAPAKKAAAPAKKPAAKVPVKKTAPAAPVKKAAVKKAAPVKKAPAKKAAPVKKAPAKKAAPVKKAPAKKAPVKKAVPAKKTVAKKTVKKAAVKPSKGTTSKKKSMTKRR